METFHKVKCTGWEGGRGGGVEILQKTVYKQKYFVITKNSNWEILTKNLVTLKDKMGLRLKNLIS